MGFSMGKGALQVHKLRNNKVGVRERVCEGVRKDVLGGEVVSDASTGAPKGSFPINIEPLDVLHCGFQHRQVVATLTLP